MIAREPGEYQRQNVGKLTGNEKNLSRNLPVLVIVAGYPGNRSSVP